MTQPLIANFKDVTVPAYSFLITRPPSGRKLLYDLGIRKDWENGPTGLINRLKSSGFKPTIKKTWLTSYLNVG
jgi:hypothetical protein